MHVTFQRCLSHRLRLSLLSPRANLETRTVLDLVEKVLLVSACISVLTKCEGNQTSSPYIVDDVVFLITGFYNDASLPRSLIIFPSSTQVLSCSWKPVNLKFPSSQCLQSKLSIILASTLGLGAPESASSTAQAILKLSHRRTFARGNHKILFM